MDCMAKQMKLFHFKPKPNTADVIVEIHRNLDLRFVGRYCIT